MRLHKLYHRLTLLPFSPLSSLPSNPSLLPPPRLTFRRRIASNFGPMTTTSRLRHLAPIAALTAEDGAAGASTATAATSTDYEGQLHMHSYREIDMPIAFSSDSI